MTKSKGWHNIAKWCLIIGIISYIISIGGLLFALNLIALNVLGGLCLIMCMIASFKRDYLEREEEEIMQRLRGY